MKKNKRSLGFYMGVFFFTYVTAIVMISFRINKPYENNIIETENYVNNKLDTINNDV